MTYSYFPPGCLLRVDPAPLRVVLFHHLLRAVLSGGLVACVCQRWHLYRKRNIFPSSSFPFPFRNLQVLIFLLARLFRQRWCSLTVGGAVQVARWRGRGEPGSAADPRCALGTLFNVFVLKCSFLFICLRNAHCIFHRDIVRCDELLSGKHPEFLGCSVYMPIFNIIFNAMIVFVSVRILLWRLLLIRTALIPLLLL